jgi:hypothetical protein
VSATHTRHSSGRLPPGLDVAWLPAGFIGAICSRAQIILAAILVFGVPFAAFYRLILFHFYVRGSFLLDTGLLASLMWNSDATLSLPPGLGSRSFFADHFSPLLWLMSAISDVLPVSMPQMFAGFTGICHGLLAVAMFWLLVTGHGMRRGRGLLLAALASGAFAFNGLALSIARYPHFETFGAACLLLCFVALVLGRPAVAIVCLLFALATREDVGLHAFGFLTMWLGVNWLRGRKCQHTRQNLWLATFAVAGLAYSTSALLVQHWAFPHASSFVRVYVGEPAYSHLTWDLLATRMLGWCMLHSAIFLPAAAALVWAERTRDPFIIAGHVACVPWALLHLLAASEFAGWMVGYYAYPFLIAMAWPLLAGVGPQPAGTLRPAANLLGLIALSLLPLGHDYDPGRITLPEAFLHAPSAEQQRRLTDQAIAAIAAARPVLGRLVVDNSVASLAPLAFARSEIAGWSQAHPNTVVFLEDGYDATRLRTGSDLPMHAAVPDTAIRIMTDRPESALRESGILP